MLLLFDDVGQRQERRFAELLLNRNQKNFYHEKSRYVISLSNDKQAFVWNL